MGQQPFQSRVVTLVDLDYPFAQCDELRNPYKKERPVVARRLSFTNDILRGCLVETSQKQKMAVLGFRRIFRQ
jgi:hypothetical protein